MVRRPMTWAWAVPAWLAWAGLLGGCSSHPDLPTVDHVDLDRYQGTWYEIARLPAFFQEGCRDSQAEYELLPDGKVSVINSCVKDGEKEVAQGTAWVVDEQTNAKLKVRFDNWISNLLPWLVVGDYWIIYLEPDYSVAIVGTPDRGYLWILSRSQTMADEKYEQLLAFCRERGFETGEMIRNSER